jgi:hypothetical protein
MLTIPNPLPQFQDSFVDRKIVGDMLVIKPILPKPYELAAFYQAARDAGFREGRETCWGLSRAPAFYYRPISEERQKDWKAVKEFKRTARFCDETGEDVREKFRGLTCDIEGTCYKADVDDCSDTLQVFRKNEHVTEGWIEWIPIEVVYY